MNICVFAASSDRPAPVFFDEAKKMGRLLAEAGHGLVFGGGASGLMGACAGAALAAGGRVTGIVPRFFDEPGFLLRESTELVFTDTMAERKEKMLSMSEAFLVLPGGIGTMDEFFEVITLRQLGRVSGRIVLLNTAGFYDPLLVFLGHMADHGFMSRNCLSLLQLCETPEEALAALSLPAGPSGSIRRLEDYTG